MSARTGQRGSVRAPQRASVAKKVVVLLMATSALSLSGCMSSASPPVNGAAGSSTYTVVHSNVTHGNLNLYLSDLSCSSENDCWATGQPTVPSGQGIPMYTLLMHYGSDSWHQVLRTGNAQSSDPPQLGHLSCPVAGWCMTTVGFTGIRVGVRYPTFAIISSGRLHLLRTTAIGAFSAIDCRSVSDCVGVGLLSGGKFAAGRWDGKAWAAMPAAGVQDQASAVSCPTSTYCLAVGSSFAPGQQGPGAMVWTGSAWRSSPRPVGKFGSATPCNGACPGRVYRPPSFSAVSCASPTRCVALGGGSGGSFGFSWDGTTWTELPGLFDAGLGAVSCSSDGSCLGVGGVKVATIAGNAVSQERPPASLDMGSQGLNAVDCPAPQQCVVLGTTAPASAQSEQMAASWDGSSWHDQPFVAPAFARVRRDNVSEELGPCTSVPRSKVVTITLVPHRGFAAVSPTCQVVDRGQHLDVHNATKGSAITAIGTTFVFTLKPGETAQLQPALSALFAPGHQALGFTGSNYGTVADLWIGSRSEQPGYQLAVSGDVPLSTCGSLRSGRTVEAYWARNEQLYRSFPWSNALKAQRPAAKMTLCVLVMPSHARVLRVLNESGAVSLSTAAPASVLVQHF
jgi:hypothetical protein